MPNVSVPEDTIRRLSERAAALNISVDEFVKPALDRLAEAGMPSPESFLPLAEHAWRAEVDAWKRDAVSRAERYAPGIVLDDSRETMYRDGKMPSFDSPRHHHPAPVP
jgi:hypothetical protein